MVVRLAAGTEFCDQAMNIRVRGFGVKSGNWLDYFRGEKLSDDDAERLCSTVDQEATGEIILLNGTYADSSIATLIGEPQIVDFFDQPKIKRISAGGIALFDRPLATVMCGSADCPTVIVKTMPEVSGGKSLTFVLHAGRDTVINTDDIQAGRAPTGIIDVMMDTLTRFCRGHENFYGDWPAALRVWVVYGICPDCFDHPVDHPEYGEKNRSMIEAVNRYWGKETWGSSCFSGPNECGRLNMFELIRRKLNTYGVPSENISHDGRCVCHDQDADGNPLWWSRRRHTEQKNRGGQAEYGNSLIAVHSWDSPPELV